MACQILQISTLQQPQYQEQEHLQQQEELKRQPYAHDWIQERLTNSTEYNWIDGDLECADLLFPLLFLTTLASQICHVEIF